MCVFIANKLQLCAFYDTSANRDTLKFFILRCRVFCGFIYRLLNRNSVGKEI